MDQYAVLAEERRAIADRLETLTPEQWRVRTLCPEWTVREMAAHLLVPIEFTPVEMITSLARARGRFERATLIMVARRASRPPAELIRRLRDQADSRKAPPLVGIDGPYADSLIHGIDMWIPLGWEDERSAERWVPALEFLLGPKATMGFLPRAAPALAYVATDVDWRSGTGPEVRGPAAALALALTGRTPWLDRLDGPGRDELARFAGR